VETWKYVDLVLKRVIVRFETTLFSFERPRSHTDAVLLSAEHGFARTLKSA
jgi:hypothetical protein